MKNIFGKFKNQDLLSGVLTLALGIVLVMAPALLADVLVKLLGAVLIAVGLFRTLYGLITVPRAVSLYGIILALVGVLVWIFSANIVAVVNIVIRVGVGILLTVHGINGLIYILSSKRGGSLYWIFYVVLYAVFIGIGVSSLLNTFNPSTALTQIIGVIMIISASLDIVSALKAAKPKKKKDGYIEVDYEDKTEK